MRYYTYCYLFLGMSLMCISCSNKQYQHLFHQRNVISDTSQRYTTVQGPYKIKPQDVLEIRNMQNSKDLVDLNPSLNGTATGSGPSAQPLPEGYIVEDDGTVALTGLGRVQVAGLTRVEAQALIEMRYRKEFLKDPVIEVKITNLSVTLFGEVKSPGNYILTKDKTTLVQIIGAAGGLTELANESNIKIIRGDQKNLAVTYIDLSNIESINDARAILQNGDIVYVEKNNRAIRNENFQSFSQLVQPALLLFNAALIIFTFIHR